ncbi:MAG: glycosyltransferase [Myxococcales bacterium]
MARFLFVVPPLAGHVNPTVSLGHVLAARGHMVAWAGHPSAVRPLLAPGSALLPLPEGDAAGLGERLRARTGEARGLAAFKQLWEDFLLPLARSMRPVLEAAVAEFEPDVVLVDQQALAGSIVARRRSLCWATLSTTSARLADSLAGLPRVKEWIDGQLAQLWRESGLEAGPEPDLSPSLILVFSSELLAGAGRFPRQALFVGPALDGRPPAADFPWDRLVGGADKRLLVSLGTVNAERGAAFYRVLADALSGEDLQIILAAPSALLPNAPANFIVQPRVPQLALLPRVRGVVCHGGHNTVCEALAHGLPLLSLPIRDDQPVIAQQVVDAGAGLRLRFGRTTAAELREAVRRLLEDPALRAAASRVADSFQRAGGARAAADAVEKLL